MNTRFMESIVKDMVDDILITAETKVEKVLSKNPAFKDAKYVLRIVPTVCCVGTGVKTKRKHFPKLNSILPSFGTQLHPTMAVLSHDGLFYVRTHHDAEKKYLLVSIHRLHCKLTTSPL